MQSAATLTAKSDSGGKLLFNAVLRPHRSLGPFGFHVLMAMVALVSFTAGMVFFLIGAWPVVGFLGLDVLLIYGAFKLSYRSGRAFETVQLSPETLIVRQVNPAGKVRTWRFQPHWVRVNMSNPPRHESQLTVSSHGRRVTLGAFLTPQERVEVADALRAALGKLNAFPDPATAR